MPNLDKAKVVAKLNNCLDLIQTPMELEDEQAFLHTVLEHKMDDVVQSKRQNLPSPVSVLDCNDSDESSCDESDNDETIASFWRKHREEKKDSEIENEKEVDVIAEKSSPVFPQKKMVLNDDEEQHDCSVFPWNIEHDLIPTGKVKRAKQIKKEALFSNFKDDSSKMILQRKGKSLENRPSSKKSH